jgi:phenylacetate-CoA ligase
MLSVLTHEVAVWRTTRALRSNLRKSRQELDGIQQRKLEALIGHAYENVPYYRRLFDQAGLRPQDIRTVHDLPKIPITTKREIRGAGLDALTQTIDHRRCTINHTAGSTGEPLKVYSLPKDWNVMTAAYRRAHVENGLRPYADKVMTLTVPMNIRTKGLARFFQRMLGRYAISVFEDMETQLSTTAKVKPTVLTGYGSAMRILASFAADRGVTSIRPRLVITGSDATDSQSRQVIESAFGVNPIDTYNSVEAGCMAWECAEHMGYHINTDTCILEFVKYGVSVSPGDAGEIIVTNLDSYTMPIIRFDTTDVGVLSEEKCRCGRVLPLMKTLIGRKDDFIRRSDGAEISPRIWNSLIRKSLTVPIRQYKIVQEKLLELNVQIVPMTSVGQAAMDTLAAEIKRVVGQDVDVRIVLVDSIPREASGKVRVMVSKIAK